MKAYVLSAAALAAISAAAIHMNERIKDLVSHWITYIYISNEKLGDVLFLVSRKTRPRLFGFRRRLQGERTLWLQEG